MRYDFEMMVSLRKVLTLASRWAACCRRVKSQHRQHFRQHLGKAKLVWSHLRFADLDELIGPDLLTSQEGGAATISKRYSHCAVYCPKVI